ncbi:MAG: hypothetical protein V3R84_06615 [Acidimicrobiia bacterium]
MPATADTAGISRAPTVLCPPEVLVLKSATIAAVLLLVAAACGDTGSTGDTLSTEPAADSAPTTSSITDTTTGDSTSSPPAAGSGIADGWTVTRVGTGIKPVLALDASDQPAIAWLVEEVNEGFVSYAAAAEEWTEDRLVEGYFYGPIGLAFDPAGNPHIAYHDHQDTSFQDDLGDLAHAVRQGDAWTLDTATDDGHDGWDSTIAIGSDGVVRAAGIDPQQFSRDDGVEYYELGPGGWQVTAIGSGPIEYEWNVSLAVSDAGVVGLSYFDNNSADLVYAELGDGSWDLTVVDFGGDVGRFSSLAFDADSNPHISYYDEDGTVRYATRAGETWSTEDVGELDDVEIAFAGARRITAIDIDSSGSPQVVFGDRSVVRHATRTAAGWETTDVFSASDQPLGQLVSFALGSDDTPHVATYEGTAADGSTAEVLYLTTG